MEASTTPPHLGMNMTRYLEPNWASKFKKHMMKTRYVQLSKEFYDYVLADGTFIHSKYTREPAQIADNDELDQDLSFGATPQFPEVAASVQKVFEEFGNKIFLKLNWKSPKECRDWLPELMCTHIEDIFMAVKCSQYMSQPLVDYEKDLQLQAEKPQLYLVLRKFNQLRRDMEFRCFINPHGNIAVCQRNCEQVYPELLKNEQMLFTQLVEFTQKEIVSTQYCEQSKGLVVDLYVQNAKIFIVDLGPWRQFTNPLLYSWEELQQLQTPKFKIVKENSDAVYQDLRNYKIPAEFGQAGPKDMIQLIQQLQNQQLG